MCEKILVPSKIEYKVLKKEVEKIEDVKEYIYFFYYLLIN